MNNLFEIKLVKLLLISLLLLTKTSLFAMEIDKKKHQGILKHQGRRNSSSNVESKQQFLSTKKMKPDDPTYVVGSPRFLPCDDLTNDFKIDWCNPLVVNSQQSKQPYCCFLINNNIFFAANSNSLDAYDLNKNSDPNIFHQDFSDIMPISLIPENITLPNDDLTCHFFDNNLINDPITLIASKKPVSKCLLMCEKKFFVTIFKDGHVTIDNLRTQKTTPLKNSKIYTDLHSLSENKLLLSSQGEVDFWNLKKHQCIKSLSYAPLLIDETINAFTRLGPKVFLLCGHRQIKKCKLKPEFTSKVRYIENNLNINAIAVFCGCFIIGLENGKMRAFCDPKLKRFPSKISIKNSPSIKTIKAFGNRLLVVYEDDSFRIFTAQPLLETTPENF